MSSSEYLCLRTSSAINIDGDLSKAAWQAAARSPRFGDMVTGDPGYLDTRAAALWDDRHLYVAFWIEEPFVELSSLHAIRSSSTRTMSSFLSIAAIATTSSKSTL